MSLYNLYVENVERGFRPGWSHKYKTVKRQHVTSLIYAAWQDRWTHYVSGLCMRIIDCLSEGHVQQYLQDFMSPKHHLLLNQQDRSWIIWM
jgi:hypothetical protein